MLDYRLLKTYSAGPNEDAAFIHDTIYICVKKDDVNQDDDILDKVSDLQSALPAGDWDSTLGLCKAASDVYLSGKLTFRLIFAIARILGCDGKAGNSGEPKPELNSDKLLDQIKSFFAAEWEIVLKGKKQPSSVLEYTLAGDAKSLEAHLEKLYAAKREAGDLQKDSLRSELLEHDDSRSSLGLAVNQNYSDCLRVLLGYAVKDGPDTFKKVIEFTDSRGDTACALAIHFNSLACIMEFINGGLDFFEPNMSYEHRRTSGIALLVKLTSKDPKRYLENFKTILSELQKNPKFDVNAPITIERANHFSSMHMLRMMMERHGAGDIPFPFEGDEDASIEDADFMEAMVPELPNGEPGGGDNDIADAAHGDAPNGAAESNGNGNGRPNEELGDAQMGEERPEEESGEERRISWRETRLLNVAASHGGIEVLRILLDLGASPPADVLHSAVGYIGETISRASYPSYVKMPNVAAGMACMEALLDVGADVNGEARKKMTALHIAAENECHEVLSMLLERGANPGKRNERGQTAGDIAEERRDSVAVDILGRFARLQRLSTFNRSASQKERESQENHDLPEDLVCVLCLVEKKEVILAPCGHKILCRRCTKRLLTRPDIDRKCPMCRSKLESFVVQIFEA